jgi:hypothetical protein
MADDINPSSTTETVETIASATAPAPKKQRAPRRQKAAAETAAADTVKTKRAYRKKLGEPAGEAKPVLAETPVAAKSKAKGSVSSSGKDTAKPAKQVAKVPATAIEEMADLVQLEEENKRLRKALAGKLRAENSDLRKRLGLA